MILLTGATGFVGGHLVKSLLGERLAVRCLVRSASPRLGRLPPGAEPLFGDILDGASLKKACRGIETVIHLVGIIQEKPGATFRAIHVLGTKNMLAAACEAGVKKFIHMSALGTREGAASRYHQTKWEAEEEVRASGLDYTIFRPAIIFGPGDGFFTRLAQLATRLPVIPIIGTGEYEFQPIFIGDVVTCFVEAAKHPEKIRGLFQLAGPERLTLNEIIALIQQTLGTKKGTVHIPLWVMAPMARLMEIFSKEAPVTREQLLMLQEGNVCDIAQMREHFPVRLSRLADILPSYLGQGSSGWLRN